MLLPLIQSLHAFRWTVPEFLGRSFLVWDMVGLWRLAWLGLAWLGLPWLARLACLLAWLAWLAWLVCLACLALLDLLYLA